MRKDFEKLFANLEPREPSNNLFDRIILAIKTEKELQKTKRLIFGFASLLLISLIALPISGAMLVNQIQSSGISYFISAAISDLGTFFVLWQDFGLAILESLPIIGIMAFLFSLAVSLFTIRLFLRQKKLLLGYAAHSISFS